MHAKYFYVKEVLEREMAKIKKETAVEDKLQVIEKHYKDLGDYIYDANTIRLNDPAHDYSDVTSKQRFD